MSQTAADLRSLVARRVGTKRRVAVLAADPALAAALEANGCTLLLDPALDALKDFRPEVVVAFDGLLSAEGGFAVLGDAAPEAELVFSFANAASAAVLLGALEGHSPPPTASERDVAAALARAGYATLSRDVVVTPHAPTGLSADTEAALRALLEQLNPSAAVDRLLLVARRGVEASEPDRVEGLLSVVVSAGVDLPALEGTLASALTQPRRPLELLVASALPDDVVERALEKAKLRAHVTASAVRSDAPDFTGRTNLALEQARGQYLAFLEAGDLVAPQHFSTLVQRLADGTAAWAVGVCRAGGAEPVLPPRFSTGEFLRAGAFERCAWVVDRERVGAFPLRFAEGVPSPQALFFARLAALFEPAWVPGSVGVERPQASAESAASLLEAMRARPLRALTTLEALLREPAKPELRELLTEAIDAKSPAAGRAFKSVEAMVRRVARAAADARESARDELKK